MATTKITIEFPIQVHNHHAGRPGQGDVTGRMIDALDAMFDCPIMPLADFTAEGYPCANGTAADGREFGAEIVDYPTPTTATVVVHVYEGDE